MVNPHLMKCDPEFAQLTKRLKGELGTVYGERISDRMLTKHIARFMQEEGLDKVIKRRAEYRRQRGGILF